ncbi:MAG: potassium channel family protein [Ancrocorticia sp.]|uniref:potassium channel family protein n=1 Tax=Ancrocorticia sp. TaxID=2593684 RepID=UPI003F902C9F
MKVLIVGAGSVGRSIARELAKSKHEVTIVDLAPGAMKVASVSQADWILGDACELETLERAGAEQTDVVVAATGDDKANLVVSLLCKTEFGVERAIARINNPKNEWLFDESWGVDVAVSTPRIITSLVEDAVADGALIAVMTFQRSGASLMQVTLPDDAPVAGTPVSQIYLPATVMINAIVRDGVPFAADPDLTLEAGDQALLLCAEGAEADLDLVAELFTPMEHPQPE